MVSAAAIKELRELTGAGMLDCRKALEETNGNIEDAVDYLREKGAVKAAKKESRIAAEGLAKIFINGNNAVIVEVNTETDFVSKNEKFISFFEEFGNIILNSDAKTNEEALELTFSDGEKVQDKLTNLVATIGEKISFRRFARVIKEDGDNFGEYIHMGGKIASLVTIKGGNSEVAKDVAMQMAAMSPKYVFEEDVTLEDKEREENVIREQIKNEGKPAEIAEKMLVGRMNKFYKEVCLIHQAFIKDDKIDVNTYLSNHDAKLLNGIRFAVGEGIEKKTEDFAKEVMEQMGV